MRRERGKGEDEERRVERMNGEDWKMRMGSWEGKNDCEGEI